MCWSPAQAHAEKKPQNNKKKQTQKKSLLSAISTQQLFNLRLLVKKVLKFLDHFLSQTFGVEPSSYLISQLCS